MKSALIRTANLGISACLVAALAPAASAQSTDDLSAALEELLNTRILVASKTAESPNAAPGMITVVSRLEIEGFAAQNLGQVLNRVVSMTLLSPDIFPNQSVVVRGEETTPYNNHILVLLDGRPMRDPITGGLNGSYWNSFPLDAVERVEIIRGPGSVLYGSCAFSGVVNIITRARTEDGISGNATVTDGNNGAFAQSFTSTFKKGEFKGIFGLTQYLDSGPSETFYDYNDASGTARFYHHSLGVVTHMEYQGATFNAYQGNYDPYTLEGSSETWVTPPSTDQQVTTHMDAGYSKDLSDKVSLGGNITYNRTEWFTGERDTTPDPALPASTTYGHAMLFELNARIAPTSDCKVLLGAGGEKSEWGGALVITGDQTSSFFYAQADYRLNPVKLIGGFQYNKIEDIKGNLSPRLGVIWEISPEFGAKVLYSSAFRKGYPNETGFNVSIFHGNPLLQPELIDTLEGQVYYQGKIFQGSLTYYNSRQKDSIVRDEFPDPASNPPIYLEYENGGTWKYSGFELEGRVSLTSALLFTGSASYQMDQDPQGQNNATLHPNTVLKGGLLYHASPWTLGLFEIHSSAPYPTTSVNPSSMDVNPQPGAYDLVSAKADWKAWERGPRSLHIAVESNDLLNKAITYPDYPNKAVNSFLPLYAGRTVLASVTLRY